MYRTTINLAIDLHTRIMTFEGPPERMQGTSYWGFPTYHVIGDCLAYHGIYKFMYVDHPAFDLKRVKVLKGAPNPLKRLTDRNITMTPSIF